MRWRVALVIAAGVVVHATSAGAAPTVSGAWVSPLALARIGGESEPGLLLAQRAIDREWLVPGDSGLTIIPHGRSALGALIFSAAAPGTGQLYAGRLTGLYFLAAEVAGWIGWRTLRSRADDLRDEARGLAGAPDDTTSAWSFGRFEQATQEDAAQLRALYAVDRDAFDEAIGGDPRYAAGWAAPETRAEFSDLRRASDRRLSQSRATESALWVNHVVAALDAVRAARFHNRFLGHGLELKAKGAMHHGRPEMVVSLERRF